MLRLILVTFRILEFFGVDKFCSAATNLVLYHMRMMFKSLSRNRPLGRAISDPASMSSMELDSEAPIAHGYMPASTSLVSWQVGLITFRKRRRRRIRISSSIKIPQI